MAPSLLTFDTVAMAVLTSFGRNLDLGEGRMVDGEAGDSVPEGVEQIFDRGFFKRFFEDSVLDFLVNSFKAIHQTTFCWREALGQHLVFKEGTIGGCHD
jgi:hypothetical protein